MNRLVLAVALLGAAAPGSATRWDDLRIASRNHYDAIQRDLRVLSVGAGQCSSAPVQNVQAHLTSLKQNLLTVWYVMVNRSSPSFMVQMASRDADQLAPQVYGSAFTLGDHLLRAGCLAEADAVYRDVLVTFSSPFYAGQQRRAQIGIDDVREARQRLSSGPSGAAQHR